MIEVTRLNGNPMMINSDLIKIAEASPDTMLTLIHGEKLIVRESCEEIAEKVLTYRARLLAAVARNSRDQGDLPRLASLASLNLEAGPDNESSAANLRTSHLSSQGRSGMKGWPTSPAESRDR